MVYTANVSWEGLSLLYATDTYHLIESYLVTKAAYIANTLAISKKITLLCLKYCHPIICAKFEPLLKVCVSCRINNTAKLANSPANGTREIAIN